MVMAYAANNKQEVLQLGVMLAIRQLIFVYGTPKTVAIIASLAKEGIKAWFAQNVRPQLQKMQKNVQSASSRLRGSQGSSAGSL